MESNITTMHNNNDRYNITEIDNQNIDSNIDTIFSNDIIRNKAIKYVVNLGKNKYYYQSPKMRHKNKSIDPDFRYRDGYTYNNKNSEKSLIGEMQNKIEEQKSEIRNLKRIIYKKDKEINELNYELYLTQNELEDNIDSEEYYNLLDEIYVFLYIPKQYHQLI